MQEESKDPGITEMKDLEGTLETMNSTDRK